MNQIRNIIGIIILITILPLSSLAFNYVSKIDFNYNEINDELALCQLREYLLISYDIKVNHYSLDFIYKNKDFSLNLVNNKLLMQPGTQIILNDIDDVYFERKGEYIYVVYTKNNETYERIIASKKGIYLDEFSDCFIDNDVSDSDQE